MEIVWRVDWVVMESSITMDILAVIYICTYILAEGLVALLLPATFGHHVVCDLFGQLGSEFP